MKVAKEPLGLGDGEGLTHQIVTAGTLDRHGGHHRGVEDHEPFCAHALGHSINQAGAGKGLDHDPQMLTGGQGGLHGLDVGLEPSLINDQGRTGQTRALEG